MVTKSSTYGFLLDNCNVSTFQIKDIALVVIKVLKNLNSKYMKEMFEIKDI